MVVGARSRPASDSRLPRLSSSGSSGAPGSAGSPPSLSSLAAPPSSDGAPSPASQLLEKPTVAREVSSPERVLMEVPGNGDCSSSVVSDGYCELTWTG